MGFRVLRARALESESGLAFAGLSDLLRPVLECLPSVPAAQRAALRARARAGAARRPRPLRRLRGHPQPDRDGRVLLAGADRRRRRPLAGRPHPGGPRVLRPAHRGRAGRDPRRLARAAARAAGDAGRRGAARRAAGRRRGRDAARVGDGRGPPRPGGGARGARGGGGEPARPRRAARGDERRGARRASPPPPAAAGGRGDRRGLPPARRGARAGPAPGPGGRRGQRRRGARAADRGPRRAGRRRRGPRRRGGRGLPRPAGRRGAAASPRAAVRGSRAERAGRAARCPSVRWRGRSTPSATWSSARGTSPRPRSARTRTSPGPSSTRPGGPQDAPATRRPPRCSSARRSSRRPRRGPGADLLAAAQMWFAAGDAPRGRGGRRSGSGRREPEGPLRAEAAHLWGFLTMLSSRAEDAFALLVARGPASPRPRPGEGRADAVRRGPRRTRCRAAAARRSGPCRRRRRTSPSTRPRSSSARSRPASPWPGGRGRPVRCSPGPSGTWRPSSPCRPRARRAGPVPHAPHLARGVRRRRAPRPEVAHLGPRGRVPRLRRLPAGVRRRDRLPARALARRRRPRPRGGALTRGDRPDEPALLRPRHARAGRGRARPRGGLPGPRGAGPGDRERPRPGLDQGVRTPSPSACSRRGRAGRTRSWSCSSPSCDYTAEQGLGEPATVMWQPDLVEAYVRLGRTVRRPPRAGDARRAGRPHRRRLVAGRRLPLPGAPRRRLRPPLRGGPAAPRPDADAVRAGPHRAGLRRAPAARPPAGRGTHGALGRALATFEDLGAAPWARRAREEIAASGAGLPRPGRPRASDELSPRELQVAVIVAEGLTNREVAARLFLSEKTVERHLGSVYRKLGLRSRTELARRFAGRAASWARLRASRYRRPPPRASRASASCPSRRAPRRCPARRRGRSTRPRS